MIKRARSAVPKWQLFGQGEEQPSMVPGEDYFMVMYPLLRTPWFAVILRKILSSNGDGEPLHSHGFYFNTIILKGSYIEERVGNTFRQLGFLSINKFNADTYHAIRQVGGPVWTLGFHKKWKGFQIPCFLIDGKPIYIWDYKGLQKFKNDEGLIK